MGAQTRKAAACNLGPYARVGSLSIYLLPMIIRVEAVVLRAFRYGETSLIVTLFTRDRGKVSVLAKGARGRKSRFGAVLQPLSVVQVVYSYRTTRTLQTLREASYEIRFRELGEDLDRITAGLRMVELVQALLQEEEPHRQVFHLLVESLQALDGTPGRPELALFYFELRLAGLLGFAPQFTRDAVTSLDDAGGILQQATGAIAPAGAGVAGRRSGRAALRAFAVVARAELRDVLRMKLTDEESAELGRLVEDYLQYHTEDAYPTRAQQVRARLLLDRPDSSDTPA